jgi:hypothetical protein
MDIVAIDIVAFVVVMVTAAVDVFVVVLVAFMHPFVLVIFSFLELSF